MVDGRSITSNEIKTRKKAVMAIVTAKDVSGIPHLEVIAQHDPDPKVRQLAQEGIVYLKKFEPVEEPEDRGFSDSDFDAVFADVDLTQDREMMIPSDFPVTELEERYAKGLVGKAIDAHVHSNRRQAIELFKEALIINPRLMFDPYTMNTASSLTGKDPETAIRLLSPDVKALKRRVKHGSILHVPMIQRVFVGILIIGWLLIVIGAFFLPWGDLSGVALINIDENDTQELIRFDTILEQINMPEITPLLHLQLGEEKTAELRAISISLNGMDMSQIFLGQKDVLNVTGLRGIADLFETFNMGLLGLNLDGKQIAADIVNLDLISIPDVMDFSVLLFPPIAFVIFLLIVAQFIKPTTGRWLLGFAIGVASIMPVAHFYNDAQNALFPDTANFGTLEDLLYIPSAGDLIGMGFWVTCAGIAFLIVIPLIAVMQQRLAAQS